VVIFSFGLGGAELLKLDVDRIALPLGCLLFVYLIVLRIWSLRETRMAPHSNAISSTGSKSF
jgi:hypothetical protein